MGSLEVCFSINDGYPKKFTNPERFIELMENKSSARVYMKFTSFSGQPDIEESFLWESLEFSTTSQIQEIISTFYKNAVRKDDEGATHEYLHPRP